MDSLHKTTTNGIGHWPTDDYWPRRLLHIPTMKSYERSGSSTYRDTDCPGYSILSYTWGRWEIPLNGCRQAGHTTRPRALPVTGTRWAIPQVSEDHFTVDNFQDVVGFMAQAGTEWAWIDVACIDQENTAIKMDEVGRQASIFNKATRAFVWLSRTTRDALINTMKTLQESGLHPSSNFWEDEDGPKALSMLRVIENAVALLLADPWFSSLRTLQEMMMRCDAVLVSREGGFVTDGQDQYQIKMENLMDACTNIVFGSRAARVVLANGTDGWRRLPPDVTADMKAEMVAALDRIEDRIAQSGLLSASMTTNPNVQYGSSRFRHARHPEDRIYGIMQIYGVRVGQSVRPADQPAPDALAREFGLAVNAHSALLGQLFVHTAAPPAGRSWCITEQSGVPGWLQNFSANPRALCTIAEGDAGGAVVAVGRHCPFREFYALGTAEEYKASVWMDFFFDHPLREQVGAPTDERFLPWGLPGFGPYCPTDPKSWHEYGDLLLEDIRHDADSLALFLLGEADASYSHNFYALILRRMAPSAADSSRSAREAGSWMRVGICNWRNNEVATSLLEGIVNDTLAEAKRHQEARALHIEGVNNLFSEPVTLELV